MIKLSQAVIVEGRYDRIKLSSIIDAVIIETNGFRIFKDKKSMELIKKLASERGIIIATDSDAAGFKIRNYIRSLVGDKNITNIYIPDIYGKEKRKNAPGAEGKVGLEGIPDEVLRRLFEKAANSSGSSSEDGGRKITKQTLYEDGLSGRDDSRQKRKMLLKSLELPEHLSANALLPVLNSLLGYEEYKQRLKSLKLAD